MQIKQGCTSLGIPRQRFGGRLHDDGLGDGGDGLSLLAHGLVVHRATLVCDRRLRALHDDGVHEVSHRACVTATGLPLHTH